MTTLRARRVPAEQGRYDYVDSFELRLPAPDDHPAEQWAREGLEGAGPLLRAIIRGAHKYVLLFRLAPVDDPACVLGWRIVESTDERARLAAESPLARAQIVAERRGPDRASITTQLSYLHPTAGRAIWTVVGPVHRRVAPYLLERAARRIGIGARTR